MKNILKRILLFVSIAILLFGPTNRAWAVGIDYNAIANMTSGRYTANSIETFTQKLKNQYIPTLLANITENFTSATPTVSDLKMGLEYTYDTSPNRALMFTTSNGVEYKLSINLAEFSSGGGQVIIDDQFYSNLNHELMHAVMFDVTTAGMIGKGTWSGSGMYSVYEEIVDRFPMWFYEGIAQVVGGGRWHTEELFTQIYPMTPEGDRRTMLKEWLDKHEWLGTTTYAQGWVATAYLGHVISGQSTINGPAIARGLDKILIDLSDGYSFSQAISRRTNNRYISLDDFNNKFADDGQDFALGLVEAIGGPASIGAGSAVANGGLVAGGQDLYYGQTNHSNFFTLDISKIGAYDNTIELTGKHILTGGGCKKTEGIKRDGSVNTDASSVWPAPVAPPVPGGGTIPGLSGGTSSSPSSSSPSVVPHTYSPAKSSASANSNQNTIEHLAKNAETTDNKQMPKISTEKPTDITNKKYSSQSKVTDNQDRKTNTSIREKTDLIWWLPVLGFGVIISAFVIGIILFLKKK